MGLGASPERSQLPVITSPAPRCPWQVRGNGGRHSVVHGGYSRLRVASAHSGFRPCCSHGERTLHLHGRHPAPAFLLLPF